MTAAAHREAAAYLHLTYGMSERRACRSRTATMRASTAGCATSC